MATNSVDDSKTQSTPDVRSTDGRTLNSESNHDKAPPDSTAITAKEKAWEAWKEKGKGSSRPPWWVLLLGLIALSIVYWMLGRGPGVVQ